MVFSPVAGVAADKMGRQVLHGLTYCKAEKKLQRTNNYSCWTFRFRPSAIACSVALLLGNAMYSLISIVPLEWKGMDHPRYYTVSIDSILTWVRDCYSFIHTSKPPGRGPCLLAGLSWELEPVSAIIFFKFQSKSQGGQSRNLSVSIGHSGDPGPWGRSGAPNLNHATSQPKFWSQWSIVSHFGVEGCSV